ncbi:MAG: DUF885 domain-containing protein [Oscillospiraceae bacterium]|nr:DUF885 domain-containing protein [Oscillospiraceae bacterium]
MKKGFGARLAVCAVLAAALIIPASCKKADPNAGFDDFTAEVFRHIAEGDTLTANFLVADREAYGLKPYPGAPATLGEFGGAVILEEMEYSKKEYEKLKAFDREKLTEDRRLTYDVLEASFAAELAEGAEDFVYYAEILSPTVGIQAQLPIVLAEYNFDGTKNLDEYIDLLGDVPNYFSQIEAFEREKSKLGLFMSRETCDDVISQCEDFTASPGTNLLITHFDEFIGGLDELTDEKKASYKEKNRDAVLNSVIPAYEALVKTLRELRETGAESGGLGNYPLGGEYYEYLVRNTVGTPKSIGEIETEIDGALEAAISDMYSALFSGGDALFTEMTGEIFSGGDDPRETLLYLKEAMERDYPALGRDVEFSVNYVDESLSEHISPAFYLVPRIDDETENKIYINPGADTSTPLFTVLAHEGFPGHMYQRNYYKQLSPAPIRSALGFTGYTEGWAVNVEKQSFYYSDLSEEAAAAMYASQEINYLVMAKADIGVNYHGWDRAELAAYLMTYNIAGEDVIGELYKQCAAEPGNVMTYAFGSAEMERLRGKAESELGGAFDLKEFHRFILEIGPAPFDVIEEYMVPWLKGQTSGGAEDPDAAQKLF